MTKKQTKTQKKGRAKNSFITDQIRQIKKDAILTYFKKNKTASYILACVALVLALGIFIAVNSHPGKVGVEIKVAPFSAKVFINDNEVRNNHKEYLAPGEYDVRVELEHFETMEQKVTVSNDFKAIMGGLQPIDAAGDDIYYQKIVDYRKTNTADSSPELTGAIYKKLPLEKSIYRVVTAYDEEEKKAMIRIYAGEPYVETAISELFKNLKYDAAISGYKITLSKYNDIFTEAAESKAHTATDVVKEAYASVIDENFQFKEELHSGRYAAVVMCTQQNTGGAFFRAYRTVLERDGNTWKILHAPYPVVSKGILPDIETTFLNRINLVKCN